MAVHMAPDIIPTRKLAASGNENAIETPTPTIHPITKPMIQRKITVASYKNLRARFRTTLLQPYREPSEEELLSGGLYLHRLIIFTAHVTCHSGLPLYSVARSSSCRADIKLCRALSSLLLSTVLFIFFTIDVM